MWVRNERDGQLRGPSMRMFSAPSALRFLQRRNPTNSESRRSPRSAAERAEASFWTYASCGTDKFPRDLHTGRPFCLPGWGAGHVRTAAQLLEGAAELADLLRTLRRTPLQPARSNQSRQRAHPGCEVGISDCGNG